MASHSEQTFIGGALWFLIRLLLVAIIIAVAIDYAYPSLPRGLQVQVMAFRHTALNHLLHTYECVQRE